MRLILKRILLAFLFTCTTLHICLPEEFIYPVAQVDERNVFIVHQKSMDELGLFLWDIESKVATKELSSMFLPSYIKMLPSKTGFSFIDRGRIRIKMFQKRAPKTIDILEPIDSIVALNWITDDQFYMVGKYRQHYKTFLCELSDISHQIYYVTNIDSMDYIYPCKIEDSLFCIVKNSKQDYFLTEQLWHPTKYNKHRAEQDQKILLRSHDPLCFLHMKNKQEGYFLRCNPSPEELLSFTCCNINKQDNEWIETKLFTFKLPTKYLMGSCDLRVYESIYPFLPNYNHEQNIYFVDYDEGMEIPLIYTYDISKKMIFPTDRIKRNSNDYKGFLAPIILQDSLCYGLILSSQKSIRSILNMDQENGLFSINLPICHLN